MYPVVAVAACESRIWWRTRELMYSRFHRLAAVLVVIPHRSRLGALVARQPPLFHSRATWIHCASFRGAKGDEERSRRPIDRLLQDPKHVRQLRGEHSLETPLQSTLVVLRNSSAVYSSTTAAIAAIPSSFPIRAFNPASTPTQ